MCVLVCVLLRAVPPYRKITQTAWGLTSRRGPHLAEGASTEAHLCVYVAQLVWRGTVPPLRGSTSTTPALKYCQTGEAILVSLFCRAQRKVSCILRHHFTSCDRLSRSAFLESTDRSVESEYRPILIGGRSIGASLTNTFWPNSA